jgi:glycosyltransferase involved in cell wall biosynthesis
MIKISVIIPIYNQDRFLEETLESLFGQTFLDWECIMVDDFSTDNSKAIALNWCKKDARFQFHPNTIKGVCNARNLAISIANATYILPLDGDDIIAPTFLEKIVETFECHPDVSLVYSKIRFFGTKTNSYDLPVYDYKKLLIQNCFTMTSAFKKSDWERVGGFDSQLESFEDWDFWIRMLNNDSQVFKIPKELFFYRKHESGSLSNRFSQNPAFYFALYDYIYTKNKALYDAFYGNPILAFQENILVNQFNEKIKKTVPFTLYSY